MSARQYLDSDGDVWVTNGDGTYTLNHHPLTLSEVRRLHGPLTVLVEESQPMTREEALRKAAEQVDAMATNARGYRDGASFADRIAAVERLARFLMGEDADA